MSSSQDISGVVQGLVKEYIVPKYPIYRIKYIKTKLIFDDDDVPYMRTNVKCRLFEIIDENEDGSEFQHRFDEVNFRDDFRITSSVLQKFENGMFPVIENCNVTYTIISAKRVA
jgi:hypothetical protein